MDKYAENKKQYVKRNPSRRQLSNKLAWLRNRYGVAAMEYFMANHSCEVCGELRLACLSIHHTDGKQVDRFKTLCHNCHAVSHSSEHTFESAQGDKPLRPKKEEPRCGTLYMYNHRGCRCEACKEVKRKSRKR